MPGTTMLRCTAARASRALAEGAALLILLAAYEVLAQAPPWRDGSLESMPQQMQDWRDMRRHQQERDRAQVESLREFREGERNWIWTEAPPAGPDGQIILRRTPSARPPNR